jgi:hypothetical protein
LGGADRYRGCRHVADREKKSVHAAAFSTVGTHTELTRRPFGLI